MPIPRGAKQFNAESEVHMAENTAKNGTRIEALRIAEMPEEGIGEVEMLSQNEVKSKHLVCAN